MMTACFVSLSFAGLVVLARSLNPIPSRTRPLNSSAPMGLWLKPWESRTRPGLPRTKQFLFTCHDQSERRFPPGERRFCCCRSVFQILFFMSCFPSLVPHVLFSMSVSPVIFRDLCRVHGPF